MSWVECQRACLLLAQVSKMVQYMTYQDEKSMVPWPLESREAQDEHIVRVQWGRHAGAGAWGPSLYELPV